MNIACIPDKYIYEKNVDKIIVIQRYFRYKKLQRTERTILLDQLCECEEETYKFYMLTDVYNRRVHERIKAYEKLAAKYGWVSYDDYCTIFQICD